MGTAEPASPSTTAAPPEVVAPKIEDKLLPPGMRKWWIDGIWQAVVDIDLTGNIRDLRLNDGWGTAIGVDEYHADKHGADFVGFSLKHRQWKVGDIFRVWGKTGEFRWCGVITSIRSAGDPRDMFFMTLRRARVVGDDDSETKARALSLTAP